MTSVLGLLLVCLTAGGSLGYVLRRRNWNDDAEQGLAEALPLLREERRRLEEQPLEGGVYWGDIEDSDRPLDIEPRLGFADKQLLEALLNDKDEGYYEGQSDPLEQTYEANGLQKAADMAELENILEPSDDEKDREKGERNKKNVPIALGGPGPDKKEFDPSVGDKKRKHVADEEEVNAILRDAVDQAEKEAADEEAAEHSMHSVTPDELNSVLGDEQEERGQEEVIGDDGDVDERVPFDVEEDVDEDEAEPEESWRPTQEEFLPAFSYAPEVPAKIKRSGRKRQTGFRAKPRVASDTDGALAREYIKRFLELEEDENTNLANALSLATMAQVEHTDNFVVPEAKFIRKAIQDEQEIQKLKESLSLDDDDTVEPDFVDEPEEEEEEEVEEEEEEEPEPVLKRAEPIIFGEELGDDERDNAIDDGPGERGLSPYLAAKLRKYLMEEQGLEEDNNVDVMPPQREQWLDRPIDMASEGLGPGDQRLNPFLRDLYRRYLDGELGDGQDEEEEEDEGIGQDGQEEEELEEPIGQEDVAEEGDVDPALIDKMEAEIEEALEQYLERGQQGEPQDEMDEGVCPALELVDGCRYAVELGLNLDNEAMDLCNRHQLCYTCGAAHGMTAEDCDSGYMSEAGELCDSQRNEGCTNEAAGLFVVMLEAHKYNTARETPAVCDTTCVVEFVTGETAK